MERHNVFFDKYTTSMIEASEHTTDTTSHNAIESHLSPGPPTEAIESRLSSRPPTEIEPECIRGGVKNQGTPPPTQALWRRPPAPAAWAAGERRGRPYVSALLTARATATHR
jgi:hypothetical protein